MNLFDNLDLQESISDADDFRDIVCKRARKEIWTCKTNWRLQMLNRKPIPVN